ncbi:MAG: hypothetical protein AB7S96_01565 [Candidatus Izemoplasmatales bacterium]|jgi:tetratricopeptide (TPR) repeat protein
MNKKQYLIAVIAIIAIDLALIITRIFIPYLDWTWILVIVAALYLYLKYKTTGPLQTFSTRFNMLVDYDLDVLEAKRLCKERVDQAPTKNIKAFYMVYLGMATYYSGDYEEAIKVFNQVDLKKLNSIYHILILSFIAYSAYEMDDLETFNLSIERIKNLQATVSRKYMNFVGSYLQVLEALKGLEDNPEHFKEVIESQFSRNDGYVSTKLIYNYRMAQYYKTINDEVEMDKCLAKVIANGKEHHTAIQARKMFKNSVNIEDYVFQEEAEEEFETVDDQQLIDTVEESPEEIEEIEKAEDEDLFK